MKLSNEVDIMVNGDEREVLLRKGGSKEEYEDETALDGDFIKVEKEFIDVKEIHNPEVEETSCAINLDPSNSMTNIDLSEVSKKIKALELQVDTVAKELQQSESEKALLKSEFDLANERLEKMDRHCEELELSRKGMKEQVLESEQKYNLQLQSLQEALAALDVKHKELVVVNEAFNELSTELESSRKKMDELEVHLVSSSGEARKFEELSHERSLHAELESKRALEFEKMLELAQLSAKEMEDQVGNLKEELERLYYKIEENQHVEESLSNTMLELSVVQEKLDLSKSQVADLEQKLVSQESIIQELDQELNLHKAFKEQMREDVCVLEVLLSTAKEDLQPKLVSLDGVELKLQEEKKARETIEASLKNQEIQTWNLQEELKQLMGEKEALQSTVADLNANLSLTSDLCSQLEAKLNLANQNSNTTDLLLSQVLSHKKELQVNLRSLEELHHESKKIAENTSQRNLDLEGLVQASNATEEQVKEQLRETEMRLISAENQIMELEKQLTIAELRCVDANRETREHHEKTAEIIFLLRGFQEDNALLKTQAQTYEDRISQLESSLSNSYSRRSELEQELKDLAGICAVHERQASATQQFSLELEDLIHICHSKAEDAGKKVGELELLLEAASCRTQELEQLLSKAEAKNREAEAQHNSRVFEISEEFKAFQTKSESLEAVLKVAKEKERELTDMLNIVTEERKKFEDMVKTYGEKFLQSENVVEALQTELKSAQDKLENIEKDIEASGVKENEMLEMLKSAEEKLEYQGRAVKQANARILELEILHKSLVKDSELKLQEATLSLTQKDSLAKQLYVKFKSFEEERALYHYQATKASGKLASLKAELEETVTKSVALESIVEELKRKLSETELKAAQYISGNELSARTNSKLQEELVAHQSKVKKLKLLADQMRFYEEKVTEVTVISVNRRVELEEALLKVQKLEGFVEEMRSKATQLETENKGLARANLNLSQELAAYESKMNGMQMALSVVIAEKEDESAQLQTSRKIIEDLMQLLASDGERLQSQISSVMEENSMLTKMYEDAKKELQAVILQMEEQINEQKANEMSLNADVYYLKGELSEKSLMQGQISELQQRLVLAETKYKEEKEVVSRKELEREATMKQSLDEAEAEHQRATLLGKQVEELKQQLQIAEKQYKEKSIEEGKKLDLVNAELYGLTLKLSQTTELEKKIVELENKLQLAREQVKDVIIEGVEVKSRDIGSSMSSLSKSNIRSEGASPTTETTLSNPYVTAIAGPMSFSFVVGIFLVSVIIGALLGKRY